MEDTFPDLGSLSDKELKDLIDNLTAEENEISYKRRVLHGKIDILRAELVNRLRQKRERGDSLISGDDVAAADQDPRGQGPGRGPGRLRPAEEHPMSAVHCPECGFANPEGANYCQKCGAYLGGPAEGGEDPTTMTYTVDDTGDMQPVDIEEVVEERRGAGDPRAAAAAPARASRSTRTASAIGRSPDAGVFLDDVTVSRNHALLVRRRDGLYIDDLGSLNGTYVNRRRIESHRLADGDEIQVGKYKLSYLENADGLRLRQPPGAPGLRFPSPQGADDRRRLQDPAERVRRRLDLQDPLPRGPEAAHPAAHLGRLPPLQPVRRRTAADDPAAAARRVPAAAGDPSGARRAANDIGRSATATASAASRRGPAGDPGQHLARLPEPGGGRRGDRAHARS